MNLMPPGLDPRHRPPIPQATPNEKSAAEDGSLPQRKEEQDAVSQPALSQQSILAQTIAICKPYFAFSAISGKSHMQAVDHNPVYDDMVTQQQRSSIERQIGRHLRARLRHRVSEYKYFVCDTALLGDIRFIDIQAECSGFVLDFNVEIMNRAAPPEIKRRLRANRMPGAVHCGEMHIAVLHGQEIIAMVSNRISSLVERK